MRNVPTVTVNTFAGIQNRTDPLNVGLNGFTAARNVDIDGTGRILLARPGRTRLNTTSYRGAYATFDKMRCYAVTAAGALESWNGNTASVLRSWFVGHPYWTQINDIVFVGNENQCWRIGPDHLVSDNAQAQPEPPLLTPTAGGTLPAGQYRFVVCTVEASGRESAPSTENMIEVDGTQNIMVSGLTAGQRVYVAPANSTVFGLWCDTQQTVLTYTWRAEQLGEELRSLNEDSMQLGKCLAAYQGRLHVAVYDPRLDQTAIYRSYPQWWGVCDPLADMKLIPGDVRAMAGLSGGLIIGTDRQIFVLADDALSKVADYGVPPGHAIAFDEHGQDCWIWTQRGLCKALPFSEATPQHAPSSADFVSTAVLRNRGDARFVAMVSTNGNADNAF